MGRNGGARPGAGRKTKAEELGLAKMLDECVSREEEMQIWDTIKKKAIQGSVPHAQLFLSYKYGKPTENVKGDVVTDITIRVVDDGDSC